jgi:very-short-patch-repair endonuclease
MCQFGGNNLNLCDGDCAECFNLSFASHEIGSWWDTPANYGVTARQIRKLSSNNYWLRCPACKHPFGIQPRHVKHNVANICPHCSGVRICKKQGCDTCTVNTFRNNPYSKYWSPNNPDTPEDHFQNSHVDRLFYHNICGHELTMRLDQVIGDQFPCGICASRKFCDDYTCQFCFNKSFASMSRVKHWDSNKNWDTEENKAINPIRVFKYSSIEHWFNCESGHSFKMRLDSVSGGSWCTECPRYKTAAKLYEWLKKRYPEVLKEEKFEWCMMVEKLPFDFLLRVFKLFIELDGRQHFCQVSNWDAPEKTRRNDVWKMYCSLGQGYSMIRINQEDVLHDRNNWEQKLIDAIKLYETPEVIYIGGAEYDKHKEDLAVLQMASLKIN